MQNTTKPLFNRSDTFFGVCEGLGTDIGVNPNLFRLAFAGLLFWNPVLCFATYFGLGVVVYALRWTMPDRAAYAPAEQEQVHGENDEAPVPTTVAA
ncbi:PspC domain-containing protein [Stakelama marina]|uniref:PspC domain-containing protein n=1 Tax=Stakelama marina TaxID=2826939 RepID=A0A8T4ICB7_9SPHN|nr:PspC domain-containing protein [Stakelama marina]MBR0552678.1 PspC domain-containing protein [Stakelama marina]